MSDKREAPDILYLIEARLDSGRSKGAPQLNKDIRVLQKAAAEIESLRQQLAGWMNSAEQFRGDAIKATNELGAAKVKIAELEQQLAEARAGRVSEGYTIVPVEPTQSMLNAMNVALTTGRLSAYRAMLEAAKRCEYCDDTGDLHTPTGEWRGVCICAAGKQQPPAGGVVQIACDHNGDPLRGHRYENGEWSLRNWNAICQDSADARALIAAQPQQEVGHE